LPLPTPTALQRLEERKLVQWALAYLAGARMLYEAADAIGNRWGLTDTFFQGLFVVLDIGFLIALVFAWYPGRAQVPFLVRMTMTPLAPRLP
jgi:hypothetical protein